MKGNRVSKTAFVHDFLVSFGGAERVLESLAKLDPDAPIYTLLYDAEATGGRFEGRDVRTSFLQRFPAFLRKRYRLLLPFFPVAAESLDLREFDTVVSSSGAWMKGIVTRLRTRHIAYLHSPMRFLWDVNEWYPDMVRTGPVRKFFARLLFSYLRVWDREAADRPDFIVSNSEYTAKRVAKYYRRDSAVLHPPVTLSAPTESEPVDREDFFLLVSRLTGSKGIEVAISAFNKLKLPLRIVGEGRERRRFEVMAEENVSFLGGVDDETLVALYRRAKAVIVPSEEDFGLSAAEAVSFGTPVIALGEGGVREIVREGETGEFFRAPIHESVADAVRRFLDRPEGFYRFGSTKKKKPFSEEAFLSAWRGLLAESAPDGRE